MSHSVESKLLVLIGRDNLDILHLEAVDSTNTLAKELVIGGFMGEALILADTQTLGRGRCGKSFFSPDGRGLYMTVILRPKAADAGFTLITAAAAVAVSKAIESQTAISPRIKWVNDIYVQNKKAGGILCESVFDSSGKLSAVIVGIGINLSGESFPNDIADTAVSLGGRAQRLSLCAAITSELFSLSDSLYTQSPDLSFLEHYRTHSCVIGKDIVYTRNGECFCGKATAICDGGELEVISPDGTRVYLSGGEISLRVTEN